MKALRKPWPWLAVLLLAVLAWIGYGYWNGRNAAPEYRTARVERGTISASVSASGTLNPVVQVQVGSQVSGQLRDVLVDFNSPVKRGQLIAHIDPQAFETRVRQAQADLDAALAQVMTQKANQAAQRAALAKAELELATAGRDLERKRRLVAQGYMSDAERENAQAALDAAHEQVNTVKAQGAVAEAGARSAQAVVKQREAALAQARIDLARTEIRAPVDGVVIKRSVERGQTVAASLQAPELFVIAESLSDMQVEAAIDESEIGRLREGQTASFTVDAFPGREYEGMVRQIRLAAQNVSNVVTYTVVIRAANPRRELLPGMTANVRVVTDARDGALKVPNAALRFRPPPGAVSNEQARPRPAEGMRQEPGAGRKGGGARGRIHLLDEQHQLRAIGVRLGLSDGAVTEVMSSELKEGMEVVIGANQAAGRDAAPSRPPGPRMF